MSVCIPFTGCLKNHRFAFRVFHDLLNNCSKDNELAGALLKDLAHIKEKSPGAIKTDSIINRKICF
jgi:hypothetical protein